MTILGIICLIVFAFVFPWVFDRICMYISKKTTKHEYGIKDTYEYFKNKKGKRDIDIPDDPPPTLYESFKKFLSKFFGGK